MEGTRIEIKKNGVWTELYLGQKNKIKYNAVINRIGETDGRKISHTNTFTIPKNYENIRALDLNEFSARSLAKSLNTKYEAKYYVEDRLFQTGFIVINSTRGDIKLNFINGGLDILDKWGTDSYQDILNNVNENLDSDYKSVISQMKSFFLPKDSSVTHLPPIGTRGYHLALFPNNLNTIGENFNRVRVEDDGDLVGRRNNGFNPYQSRPIFNAFALIELACKQYDYEAIFDPTVDTELLKRTYIVSSGMAASYSGQEINTKTSPTVGSTPFLTNSSSTNVDNNTKFDVVSTQAYFSSVGVTPNSINGWTPPKIFTNTDYEDLRTIYVPNISQNFLGEIRFNYTTTASDKEADSVYAIWNNTFNNGVVFKLLTTIESDNGYSVAKSQLESKPSNAGDFVGVINFIKETEISSSTNTLSSLSVSETFLPTGVLELDADQQYTTEFVDLTHAASTESIKTILKSILEKEGLLMDIQSDVENPFIKFFTYEKYSNDILSGDFTDLGQYLLKYYDFNYNTNFGNRYGVINRLGLQSPYPGNEFLLKINTDIESKLKEEATNYVPKFKDVTNVLFVANTSTPYFEYTNEGLGMVEFTGNLGSLEQIRSDNSVVGSINNLPALANVNYLSLPKGQRSWYKLVNEAVKAEPTFLIPLHIVRNLDITKPVYLSELGGYYLIEEIKEYVDKSTPVTIRLIKISVNGEFNSDFSNAFNNR